MDIVRKDLTKVDYKPNTVELMKLRLDPHGPLKVLAWDKAAVVSFWEHLTRVA